MARTYLLWGTKGTWKTSFALEEASEHCPVSYHELELGGFKRAAARLGLDPKNLPGWFRLHQYRTPVPELESMGTVILSSKGNPMPQLRYDLTGWTDIIADFNGNYMQDCKDGYRPVTDTQTRLWLAQRQAYEQQIQEATSGGDSAKLDRLKYTTPNSRMTGATEFADSYDLDAIFISHEKQVYNSDPPIYVPDTWGEAETAVDVSLRFRLAGGKGIARVDKGSEAGGLVGLDIPEPTLGKVNTILDNAAMLVNKYTGIPGLPIKDIDLLLNTEKVGMLITLAASLRAEDEEIPTDLDTLMTLAKLRGLMV